MLDARKLAVAFPMERLAKSRGHKCLKRVGFTRSPHDKRTAGIGATLPLVHEPAKDSCPHPLRSLLRDGRLQTGFPPAVLRDYTGASDFRRQNRRRGLPQAKLAELENKTAT